MILKVREAGEAWSYYGDVEKVQVRDDIFYEDEPDPGVERRFFRRFANNEACVMRPDETHITKDLVLEGATPPKEKGCKAAFLSPGKGNVRVIAFNTPAFLLNNDGKTIERL